MDNNLLGVENSRIKNLRIKKIAINYGSESQVVLYQKDNESEKTAEEAQRADQTIREAAEGQGKKLQNVALDCCAAQIVFWSNLQKELKEMDNFDENKTDIQIRKYFATHTDAFDKLLAMNTLLCYNGGHP